MVHLQSLQLPDSYCHEISQSSVMVLILGFIRLDKLWMNDLGLALLVHCSMLPSIRLNPMLIVSYLMFLLRLVDGLFLYILAENCCNILLKLVISVVGDMPGPLLGRGVTFAL